MINVTVLHIINLMFCCFQFSDCLYTSAIQKASVIGKVVSSMASQKSLAITHSAILSSHKKLGLFEDNLQVHVLFPKNSLLNVQPVFQALVIHPPIAMQAFRANQLDCDELHHIDEV